MLAILQTGCLFFSLFTKRFSWLLIEFCSLSSFVFCDSSVRVKILGLTWAPNSNSVSFGARWRAGSLECAAAKMSLNKRCTYVRMLRTVNQGLQHRINTLGLFYTFYLVAQQRKKERLWHRACDYTVFMAFGATKSISSIDCRSVPLLGATPGGRNSMLARKRAKHPKARSLL